ncbi:MAG: chromate transporter [Rhodospirillales bacterium 69-11]|nr:chromate transporter [Rhodospirillales bacterium]OJW21404.1 MAG: chromate transporter [Rhodospirillales bacterium 69-11]
MLPQPPPPTRRDLFLGFLGVGVCGFGGVLPWARRMIVDQRRWLSATEFTDLLGLCQFLPGPNVINLSVALGSRFHGVSGAASAFCGLMFAPMAIVIALGALYAQYGGHPTVRHAFLGLAAAASGLVLATALKISAPLRTNPVGIGIAAVTLAAIAVVRLPLPIVLLVMAPLSIFVTTRAGR